MTPEPEHFREHPANDNDASFVADGLSALRAAEVWCERKFSSDFQRLEKVQLIFRLTVAFVENFELGRQSVREGNIDRAKAHFREAAMLYVSSAQFPTMAPSGKGGAMFLAYPLFEMAKGLALLNDIDKACEKFIQACKVFADGMDERLDGGRAPT